MARAAVLFNLHQGRDQLQARVGDRAGEVDQVVEQVERPAPLGAHPPRLDPPPFLQTLDQQLAGDNWLDHRHVVRLEQGPHLITDRGEPRVLHLNQPPVPDSVNPVPPNPSLHLPLLPRVVRLELLVEGGFHGGVRREE